MTLIFIIIYVVALYLIISNGHKSAVQKSESAIKSQYDQLGESGEISRKLMRDAGYNV